MSPSVRRLFLAGLLLLTSLALGCARGEDAPSEPALAQAAAPLASGRVASAPGADVGARKVARKADLTMEVVSVERAHAKAVAAAERSGGYLAGSARSQASKDVDAEESASLSLRVPSERLTLVLTELRALASGAVTEQIASEDVTDEVVDLEARLRNQRRLEEQLLELSKSATNVEAALKVHQELGNARGEIERLEGRRQFLERQTSMATIELHLREAPQPRVARETIASSFSRAYEDSLSIGSGIVIGAIRLTGVMVPMILLLAVPSLLSILLLRRLWSWRVARRTAALNA